MSYGSSTDCSRAVLQDWQTEARQTASWVMPYTTAFSEDKSAIGHTTPNFPVARNTNELRQRPGIRFLGD